MVADGRSLIDILNINTGLLEIPFFQRGYVWNDQNWEELFDDLLEASENSTSHFLGSIILKSYTVTGQPSKHIIIDGQQRLTTLSILLKAIYDNSSGNTKKARSGNVIASLFYQPNPSELRYEIRIKHSKVDSYSFKKIIGNVVDGDVTSPNTIEINEETPLIERCYKYFSKRLLELIDKREENKINNLFNFLMSPQKKILVGIDLSPNDREQQIFDTINSAGVKLSSTDIIKNALFQKLLELKKNDEKSVIDFYDETWGETFCKDEETLSYWGTEKSIGRLKRDYSEILLQAVATIKGIYDPTKKEHTLDKIPDFIKTTISNMNENELKNFIKEIVLYAELYRENIREFDNKTLYEFDNQTNRLFHILDALELSTFTPYILFLLEKYNKNDTLLKEKLHEVELLVIRRMITGYSTKNYNKECIDFIKEESKVSAELSSVSDGAVLSGLKDIGNKNATLLLFWIELHRRCDPKFDTKTLQYNYTLENIMPQKWEENWHSVPYKDANNNTLANTDENSKNRYAAIKSLGNMTLLNGRLNASISNSTFKEKIEGRKEKGKKEIKGVKHYATLSITRNDIINDIYEATKEWNEYEIFQREKKLGKEVLEIWGVGK